MHRVVRLGTGGEGERHQHAEGDSQEAHLCPPLSAEEPDHARTPLVAVVAVAPAAEGQCEGLGQGGREHDAPRHRCQAPPGARGCHLGPTQSKAQKRSAYTSAPVIHGWWAVRVTTWKAASGMRVLGALNPRRLPRSNPSRE